MPFAPVILWTDALVFLLVFATVAAVVHVRRREHLAAPWRRVFASPSGMVGLTILLPFVAIGLLDSMHYRERLQPNAPGQKAALSVEVRSVLDALLGPLQERREKTYSAPLAWRLFAKETIEQPDGRQTREYPRLRHGGVHLAEPEKQIGADVARRAFAGAAMGFVVWIVLATVLCAGVASKRGSNSDATFGAIFRGETQVPWRAVLITLLVLLVVGCAIGSLAMHYHVFGTSKVGQDVLYQTLKSIRTGLVIGTLTTLVTLPFAVLLGIAAGYFRGWVDDVIQYVYTTLNSIPSVLLIAAAVLMMQVYVDTRPELFQTTAERADLKLLLLCVILGVTSWTSLCRLLRGETLKIRELEYMQAAQAFGVRHASIIARHILPNVMHIVLISVVMEFSGLVLAEAVLAYVGVGVDPSMISFGTMINAARLEMAREPMVWWSLSCAFVFMFLLVLSANLFADAVRDAFDPRAAVRVPLKLRLRGGAR
jgi:peptide/nickel transport system permease protein